MNDDLPIVATNVGDNYKLVRDRVNGYIKNCYRYPWHPECHGWSGDALRGVVSSQCKLLFFDNFHDLSWCHYLWCDGEMLKVPCNEK